MRTPDRKSGLGVLGAGAAACAACCAGPVLGFLAATGVATLLGAVAFGAIGVVGFLDAGRVQEGYEGESNDLRVGGGGGIFLRILRSTQLGINFAGGPDGFLFSMGTGWTF